MYQVLSMLQTACALLKYQKSKNNCRKCVYSTYEHERPGVGEAQEYLEHWKLVFRKREENINVFFIFQMLGIRKRASKFKNWVREQCCSVIQTVYKLGYVFFICSCIQFIQLMIYPIPWCNTAKKRKVDTICKEKLWLLNIFFCVFLHNPWRLGLIFAISDIHITRSSLLY